jgi:hypothetical protein
MWSYAAVLTAGLLCGAQTGFAQAVDGEFEINDDKSSSTAFLDAEGNEYGAEVRGVCTSGVEPTVEMVVITVATDHPDRVKIGDKKAEVGQRDKSNLASSVNVAFDDPVDDGNDFDVDLECLKRARVEVDVDVSKNQGKFKADLQECTGLDSNQGAIVRQICDGNSSVKGRFDGTIGEVQKARIRGKGTIVSTNVTTTTSSTSTTAPTTTSTTAPTTSSTTTTSTTSSTTTTTTLPG